MDSELERLNNLGASQTTEAAFFEIDTTPARPPLDRSSLEAYADCPYAAACRERGLTKVMPTVAEVGVEAHKVFAAGVQWQVDNFHQCTAGDVRTAMEEAATYSRPDLQPEVLVAVRAALWPFAQFLAKEGGGRDQTWAIRPSNILGFSGGEPDKSGQLSMSVGIETVTGELDLLWQGPSRDELNVEDYKTGHAQWTTGDVAESFQFQVYAALVLSNYPLVETVNTRIWNTRHGTRTGYVQFHRRDLGRWLARINQALATRFEWADAPLEKIPTWPTVEKCPTCLAATICPAVDRVVWVDPKVTLKALIAAEAKRDAVYAAATKHVDATGEIVLEDGTAFGRQAPKADRKPAAKIYTKGAPE